MICLCLVFRYGERDCTIMVQVIFPSMRDYPYLCHSQVYPGSPGINIMITYSNSSRTRAFIHSSTNIPDLKSVVVKKKVLDRQVFLTCSGHYA